VEPRTAGELAMVRSPSNAGPPIMDELFRLSMPWWHFVIRAIIVYIVILVFVRLSGKRTLGQFTAFDTLLLILIGTAVQNSLIGDDVSLAGGLILAATLITLNFIVAWITARSSAVSRVVEGVPVLVARDGQVYTSVLRRENVSEEDFEEAMRRSGCRSREDVEMALLETNGRIAVINKPGR
jgi:uncharacterized membrane protein YcaP (DUF421 family)